MSHGETGGKASLVEGTAIAKSLGKNMTDPVEETTKMVTQLQQSQPGTKNNERLFQRGRREGLVQERKGQIIIQGLSSPKIGEWDRMPVDYIELSSDLANYVLIGSL